jgi:hypothetical protein
MTDAERAQLLDQKLKPSLKGAFKRTELAPDAPAPKVNGIVAQRGPELTSAALEAWNQRVSGAPIIDVAHTLGLSIESAKLLIKEVHDAIHEDLKANLDLNRQLDLARIDQLISAYLPPAKGGDTDSANVVLRALTQRSKLTGSEPLPDPGRAHPENVLVWINQALPRIGQLVDSLPAETY